MSKKIQALVVVLLAVVAMYSSASAQIDPLGSYLYGLTKEDQKLMQSASALLYTNPNAEVGMFETWSNPKSGNSGTVNLVKKFEAKGMSCWRLRHSMTIKHQGLVRKIEGNRCKTLNGERKIL